MVKAHSRLGQGSDRGTVAGARNSELGCRHSGHGGGSGTGTQGTAAAEVVAGRSGHGWEGKKM